MTVDSRLGAPCRGLDVGELSPRRPVGKEHGEHGQHWQAPFAPLARPATPGRRRRPWPGCRRPEAAGCPVHRPPPAVGKGDAARPCGGLHATRVIQRIGRLHRRQRAAPAAVRSRRCHGPTPPQPSVISTPATTTTTANSSRDAPAAAGKGGGADGADRMAKGGHGGCKGWCCGEFPCLGYRHLSSLLNAVRPRSHTGRNTPSARISTSTPG